MAESINKAGLRAVVITVIVLIVLFAIYFGISRLITGSASEAVVPTITPNQVLADLPPDADGDGLPDYFEALYQTDPTNADTDGDGVSDFDELELGRDPTIPGPNDESKPPTGDNVVAQDTFTTKYLASLPTDAGREEVLDKERLEAFVSLNKGLLLPELAAGTIKTSTAEGAGAIEAYLEGISATHNSDLVAVTNDDVEQALVAHLQNNSSAIEEIVTHLEHNIDTLGRVTAPAEVVELHTTLVAASQALYDNVVLLRDIDSDFVGGLIASQKIDELGAVFQEIAKEVETLEAKYEL